MTLEDRVARLEAQYGSLRVPPVRDEVLRLRDAHGARLGAIEARLGDIEGTLRSDFDVVHTRLGDVEAKLDLLLGGSR